VLADWTVGWTESLPFRRRHPLHSRQEMRRYVYTERDTRMEQWHCHSSQLVTQSLIDRHLSFARPIFCCAYAETVRIPLPVKILTHNLKPPWAVSCCLRILVALSTRFMRVLSHKTAFVMPNFRNLRASGSGGDHF